MGTSAAHTNSARLKAPLRWFQESKIHGGGVGRFAGVRLGINAQLKATVPVLPPAFRPTL
jgi:hypothetical protein